MPFQSDQAGLCTVQSVLDEGAPNPAYMAAIESATAEIARGDAEDRYAVVGRLMNRIADLIGTPDEWFYAGEHYRIWAELHDVVDLLEDRATFDAAAARAALEWLQAAGRPDGHTAWLSNWRAQVDDYHQSERGR